MEAVNLRESVSLIFYPGHSRSWLKKELVPFSVD